MAIVAHGSTGGVGLPAKLAGTGPGSQRLESCGMSGMILDELSWRGLIAQSTDLDTLAAEAQRGPMTVYAGFDPTAPSLHAGHLVPLLTLRRFQRAGHRPIVLAGGATGMIGDPRDVGERSLNEADTVAEWTERIRGQLERFVDFDDSPMGAIVENNLEWTGSLSAIEFLRDIGKHFSVNVMLARDTIRRRLAGEGLTPNSATCCCRPTTTSNCTGATAARCRSVVQISGATSLPASGWCARSSVPPCMRLPSPW